MSMRMRPDGPTSLERLAARDHSAPVTLVCPPVEGGVLDYARLVAEHAGAALAFYDDGALVPQIGADTPNATLYVQFSGYGYQKRGVPLAFVAWLEEQKRAGRRIGVFFHELYATSTPRHSAFWLSPLQRHLTARIARLAEFWITNRAASAAWLLGAGGKKPHAVLPVCSNVGELTEPPKSRDPMVVVFGGPHFRRMVYDRGSERFLAWCRDHGFAIHDAGHPIDDHTITSLLGRHGVIVHGRLATPALSALLGRARAGATGYPIAYAAKSSTIAAFAAHGCAPIVFADDHGPHDGLVPGQTYLAGDTLADDAARRLPQVADAAWRRYQTHAVRCHVSAVRTTFERSRHAA